uniref:NrS-1 polymerase-like helicase domain-containing protein n=1 Tax=Pithovirus LCPAC304 TaxID=2506594 RepID=A0A481Z9E7_9VIRU|nr:MAG: hypothetical protein LCPAC304_04620 [Pithovirus LCPAC304]
MKWPGSLRYKTHIIFDESAEEAKRSKKIDTEILKRFITADTVQYESKCVDPDNGASYHIFYCISNNVVPFPTGQGWNRRVLQVEVSPKYKGNKKYFCTLYDTFTQETANHFFTYLLTEFSELDFFDLTNAPETESKNFAIEASKTTYDLFAEDLFYGNMVLHSESIIQNVKGTYIRATNLSFLFKMEYGKNPNNTALGTSLKKFGFRATRIYAGPNNAKKRVRVWESPSTAEIDILPETAQSLPRLMH